MRSNPFWRNTRTEKHHADGDPLNTDPPAAPPAAPPGPKKLVCEFCECQLAPSGEVLRMGEAAKNYRKLGETIEAKDKEIRRLEGELQTVKTERDALKASANGGGSANTHHKAGQRVTRG